jgi:hypothetical protein
MSSYSAERKVSIIRKLLLPQNIFVGKLSRKEGITQRTADLAAFATTGRPGRVITPEKRAYRFG